MNASTQSFKVKSFQSTTRKGTSTLKTRKIENVSLKQSSEKQKEKTMKENHFEKGVITIEKKGEEKLLDRREKIINERRISSPDLRKQSTQKPSLETKVFLDFFNSPQPFNQGRSRSLDDKMYLQATTPKLSSTSSIKNVPNSTSPNSKKSPTRNGRVPTKRACSDFTLYSPRSKIEENFKKSKRENENENQEKEIDFKSFFFASSKV